MNKATPWTSEEEFRAVELREMEYTHAQIAKELGRSVRAVEKKFAKLRKPADWEHIPDSPVPAPKTCEERADYWKKESQRLQGVLSSQQHEKTAVDILVEAAHELAPKSYQPAPYEKPKVIKARGKAQSAVLFLSDQHIGKVVSPDQTHGIGRYDFQTFLRRLARVERSVLSILKEHTATPITELVVMFGGDTLDGALPHGNEADQQNTILMQVYSAAHAHAQLLRNLSVVAPIRVYGVSGNHTRFQNQKRCPTVNLNSNFDHLTYTLTEALTKDIPRIKWHLDMQPSATFTVEGFPFYLSHGHELRGCDRALGIPAHSIGRHLSFRAQTFPQFGQDVPAVVCHGHFHRAMLFSHAKGDVVFNGSMMGPDNYALTEAFNITAPVQLFWLMHADYGRSATYQLRLDKGDDEAHHYQLPDKFQCL